jgi:glycosyltransferase involved in cell wall biosynthesis
MKILILSNKMPWPPKDGGAIATLNMALGLSRCGAEVTLLAMNTGKHYFPLKEIPDYILDMIHLRSVDVDTRIRPLHLVLNLLFSSYPYIAERFISQTFEEELEACLREQEIDIVQIEGPYLGYYSESIRNRALFSLRAHNLEHRIWELRAREEKNLVKKWYFRSLSRRILHLELDLLRKIDLLVPISRYDAEQFMELQPGVPFHISPAGMDMENYTNPPLFGTAINGLPEKISLFYIGALDWGPNQEGLNWFFEKVWPAILQRWPEQMLYVAGRNSSRYFSSAPPPNVIPEGEVEDAISFYQEHNVMIVPLLSGSGIRIKILEAMALGKLVICSSIAAAGLDARNGQHLFIADSTADFLRILEQLENQPSLIQETGHQARQFVTKNFDNLVLSKNLISFYKEQLA